MKLKKSTRIYSHTKSLILGLSIAMTLSACNSTSYYQYLMATDKPTSTKDQIEIPIILPLNNNETPSKNIKKEAPIYVPKNNATK